MHTAPILARFEDLSTVDGHGHPHVRLSRDGPRIIMRTNERHVRMRQLIARIVAVAAVLAGLAFVPVSLWGIALAMAGFGAFALIPRFVRVSTLLRIDLETGEIVALQRAASPGAPIPIEYVRSIEGVYKIQGWDGDSTIYAVLADGSRTPLLVFSGTNEALAVYACRILGYLLDRPATYTGPFGGVTVCYRPE